MTREIVRALAVRLKEGERQRMGRTPTSHLEAYDLVLRGQEERKRTTREANTEARRLFVKARDLDPGYARAYAGLSWVDLQGWQFLWSTGPESLQRARELAERAMALDDTWSKAIICSARSMWEKDHDRAIAWQSARSRSPPTTPTGTRPWPRCWRGRAGRRTASGRSARPCA